LFVSPSASLAREYAALGMPSSKMIVSDNGMATLPPGDAIPQRQAGLPVRFGFVGTLAWHKGVHVLIDAVRALPSNTWELVVFGDERVAPEYSSSLREQARGLPIRFAGSFARRDITRAYAEIDVLVVPSIWLENSPLVIHEAFLAGVPVVGSRLGGTADLIEHGVSGLLYDPHSAPALMAALRTFTDDPAQVKAFARRRPAVKGIDDDALDWDARYERVIRAAKSGGGRP